MENKREIGYKREMGNKREMRNKRKNEYKGNSIKRDITIG